MAMQFLLLKGATTEKNDIIRESHPPIVSLSGRVLRMTTGRIFADNGFLGSFSPVPSYCSPLGLISASLPLSSLARFRRSSQTTSESSYYKLSAGRDALGSLPHASPSPVNFRRTSAALERTRSPKLIPHECHNPADEKPGRRNGRFIPGNEKMSRRAPLAVPLSISSSPLSISIR